MTTARADVRVVAVARLANYIAGLFGREKAFARLGVRGEISNLRAQPNGNCYFDLKDREALLNCVAFSEAAASFPGLANGDEVVAYGSVQTYAKASRYQLRVLEVEPVGSSGALHRRYEALKARLSAEGLFEAERKRVLPRFPFRVALITSQQADGARDFITQARARAPHVRIDVFATPVQGENAAPEIVRAIGAASAGRFDLIVLARGGGSFEDLFAFSDERVVRALAAAAHPTVSAIGHEADVPLTDFVADHRAATPSAAAQTVLPRRDELLALVAEHRRMLGRDVERLVAARRQHVDVAQRQLAAAGRERVRRCGDGLIRLERRLSAAAPASRLAQRRGRYEAFHERLERGVPALLQRRGERLSGLAGRLQRVQPGVRVVRGEGRLELVADRLEGALSGYFGRRVALLDRLQATIEGNNPEAILQRGYAIVYDDVGRPLRDPLDAPPGTRITAKLAHGSVRARVERDGTNGGRQISLF